MYQFIAIVPPSRLSNDRPKHCDMRYQETSLACAVTPITPAPPEFSEKTFSFRNSCRPYWNRALQYSKGCFCMHNLCHVCNLILRSNIVILENNKCLPYGVGLFMIPRIIIIIWIPTLCYTPWLYIFPGFSLRRQKELKIILIRY